MAITFAAWALDPARTLEERYGIEHLIEEVFPKLHDNPESSWSQNYEVTRRRKKARALNPAYQPRFTKEKVEETETFLSELSKIHIADSGDRPLRDLSFLQFCPALKDLTLFSTEIRDWSPLRFVPALTSLIAHSTEAHDLRPIGELTQLDRLWLNADCPWPDLRGFEKLEALREFHYGGNLLALHVLTRLPSVREAKIRNGSFNVPLRDLFELPEMPQLRTLFLENTWRLHGIERSPLLINLEIFGYFDDLTPLSVLSHLTHLRLSGGEYESISSLATLPELRWIEVRSGTPHDYTPLAEAPRLHQIAIDLCETSRMEVETLNAALSPWSDDFALAEARPLAPVRLLVRKDGAAAKPAIAPEPEPLFWEGNPGMMDSETDWFKHELTVRLDALLGPGWNLSRGIYVSGEHCHVTISRLEDIERLLEIIETLRLEAASAALSRRFLLLVDSFAQERERQENEAEDIGDGEEDEFDAESERQNWEDRKERQREQREFLERAHRYKLQQQQGLEIRPEDFAPALPPPDEDESGTEDASADNSESHIHLHLHLTGNIITVDENDLAYTEYFTGLKADLSEDAEANGE